jgi:hypothetical protein
LDEAAALSKAISKHIVAISTNAAVAGENNRGDKNAGATVDAVSAVEGLTALGLYITALQQGAADPRATLLPTLIQFGLAEKTVPIQKTRPKRVERTPEKMTPPVAVTNALPALNQGISAVVNPAVIAIPAAVPTDLATAMHAIQKLTAAQAELKKIIQERDKRINALELVLASLSNKLKNAEGRPNAALQKIM